MAMNIRIIDRHVYINPDNSSSHHPPIKLKTIHWVIAKIQNFIASLFCCLSLDTAVKITIGNSDAYVSRFSLAPLYSGKEEAIEEEQLKEFAKDYFQTKHVLPTPLALCQRRAEDLADAFLAEKSKTAPYSGYHVHIYFDTSEKTRIVIKPWGGEKNQPIKPAPLLRDCSCCNYRFEHTRKMNNPFTNRLTDKIKAFDMFAIFSKSNNLLIIPDTQKPGIEVAAFPHLFALDKEQLCKVFSAIFTIHAALEKEFPSYQGNIVAHVGQKGSQTEGLLHMRFENLPPEITQHSPF